MNDPIKYAVFNDNDVEPMSLLRRLSFLVAAISTTILFVLFW